MNHATRAIIISFITNILLTFLKIIIGIFFKSKSLIADGIHSLSDLSTDVVAYVGTKMSRKPADKEHPFGHGKTEYLTSMFIGLIVFALGFTIILNSESTTTIPSILVICVTLFTISAKYLVSSYLIKKGKKLKNNILISSGKESKADVISSIVVLISSVLLLFQDNFTWLKYVDTIATIIVGVLILKTGYTILKDNVSIILGKQEDDLEYLDNLKKVILSYDKVIEIDNLVILKYGPYYSLNLELKMPDTLSLKEAHTLVHEVEKEIKTYDERIEFITTHVNPK